MSDAALYKQMPTARRLLEEAQAQYSEIQTMATTIERRSQQNLVQQQQQQ